MGGFTGWKVCGGAKWQIVRGDVALDVIFLSQLKHVTSADVVSHIADESSRLSSAQDHCVDKDAVPTNADCTAPVVGPDDPTAVHYDVDNDDDGCFVTKQQYNNCYDYGNDIVTNTFAQPGRGSSVCPPGTRPCVPNRCEDVKNAAISDGLTWVGTDLPTNLTSVGHYVSLHIWPNSNFHWIRMDADMKWSHKPGGSPVRNVDNSHDVITDPSKADFSPWTEHCGYLHTVPSKVVSTLNAPAPPVVV